MIAVSVRQSVMRLSSALLCKETAIHILFGVNTLWGPRNIVLDGGPGTLQ